MDTNIMAGIKNFINFKKPTLCIVILVIILTAALFVAFTSNPKPVTAGANAEETSRIKETTDSGQLYPADTTSMKTTDTTPSTTATKVQTTVTNKKEQPEITIGYADLTHDGVKEKLTVDLSNIDTGNYYLKVYNSKGKIIWTEAAGIPHVAWNSLYLYTKDGKDYLLRYNPYMSTGSGDYRYELFWIGKNGMVQTIRSDKVEFDNNTKANLNFDIPKLAAFYDQINKYLSNSYLLLSTEGGELAYSTETNKIIRSEKYLWLNGYDSLIQYSEKDTIQDKLKKYQDYLTKAKE